MALTPGRSPSVGTCDSPRPDRRVLEVGPGKPLQLPSEAAVIARDGDVVRIAAGEYRGDVATWAANGISLCGVGGRAKLFADGRSAQGKAIWVIAGADVVVDGIDFHDARVQDRNGAGIRAGGGDLTVRNSGFYDNENGILGGDGANVTIEGSEFARNGHGDGQSHNIYVGFAKQLIVRTSFFHEARSGHNLKSRAKVNQVENSYFMDGPSGNSSYLADFPSGGVVLLRGNLMHKGPNAENSTAIAFGAEGLTWPINTVDLVHNTVVMTRPGGHVMSIASAAESVRLVANVFAGTGSFGVIKSPPANGQVVARDNFSTNADQFPGADNIANPVFWPPLGLLPSLTLGGATDIDYVQHAPRPLASRLIVGRRRLIGALQSKP